LKRQSVRLHSGSADRPCDLYPTVVLGLSPT
jgi:hypothetical protein